MTGGPRQREWWSLLPIFGGLHLLLAGSAQGWLWLALLPGVLLLATGVSLLLWPGEGKHTQFLALGAVLGALLSLPALFIGSFVAVALAVALSAASFVIAGRLALVAAPEADGAPAPALDWRTCAKAALDEALVGYFVALSKVPEGRDAERMCQEARAFDAALQRNGWLDDPARFHRAPTAPVDARLSGMRAAGRDFTRLSFTSGFIADAELPGAAAWSAHRPNQDCHAHVLRHDEPGRPWLLCIHGYRMGTPVLDLRLFPPQVLHDRLGLNLVMPTLPLHGARRIGRRSGDHFLDGDLLELVHAESHALWDLRRMIAWIRAEEPGARIGVLGYSLGGYNAALLAAHEPGLDFVVAGIPVCDFASVLWQHIPVPQRAYFNANGLDEARYRRLLTVVSPTAVAPKLAADRLHLFAGTADRVVPPDQPLRLAAHWQRPVVWFSGAHLTFRGERSVVRCIQDAMTGAGWLLRPVGRQSA